VLLWSLMPLLVIPDRTNYFEAAFANARSVVEPSIADQALWLYEVSATAVVTCD
jgi:hypothetical protein